MAALAAVAQAERLLADSNRVCDPCSIDFRLQAASASARAGDLVRARRHLADAERVVGMWQGGPWSAAVWEARAMIRLAEGEPSQAVAFLREAANGFAQAQRPVDEARCRAAAEVL
jgi:ATP/maltotriose-dependent transcriptional regulator MalT